MCYNERKADEETVSVVRVYNMQRDENHVTERILSMPEMKRWMNSVKGDIIYVYRCFNLR